MARFATHLPNGTSGPEGLTRLTGKLLSGTGDLGSGDLAVSAQTTPDMTVKAAAGDVAIFSGAIVYHGWSTGNETVTIQSNVSGSSKTDSVVAYIDPTLASGIENNPDAFVLTTVRGASGAPTGTEITAVTAIGAKPYAILADVVVGNGVTSINSGNVVDRRTQTTIADSKIGGTWQTYNPTVTVESGTFSLGNGTLTGRYKQLGTTVVGWALLVRGTTTTMTGGAVIVTVPVTPRTNTTSELPVGDLFFVDSSTGERFAGQVVLTKSNNGTSPNQLYGAYPATAATPALMSNLGATTPALTATGDNVLMTFTYEAAS